MNRRPSNISSLVAGRIRPVRKGPPGLRLRSSQDHSEQGVLLQDQVQGLLTKLGNVVSAARTAPSHTAEDLRLVQACIDTTVDAIDVLLAQTSPDGFMLSGELRAMGLFSMKSGGCNDVARTTLEQLQKIIDRSASLFTVSSRAPAIGEVAAANYDASQTATGDADLAETISRLTQIEVLTQTSNQYSHKSHRTPPDIFEILAR